MDYIKMNISKYIEDELNKAPLCYFESEKDLDTKLKKKRYNFNLRKKIDDTILTVNYGIYFIFDEENQIYYIGEGDVRDRLRSHFHAGKIKPDKINMEEFRKNYTIKIINVSDEFSNKVKYTCRYIEQAAYLYFDNPNLYTFDGSKKKENHK